MKLGRAQSLFPVLLMAGLALLTTWLERTSRAPEAQPDPRLRHDPDFFVERFSIVRHDRDGRPRHIVEGRRMTHFPDNDTTEVDAPRAQLMRAGGTPTNARSDRAMLSARGDEVDMLGGVVFVGAARPGRAPVEMRGEHLHLVPDAETADTQSPVQIIDGKSRLTGTGMDFDQKNMLFTLHNAVRGQFERRRD